jgi:hypothetical protein
VIVTKSVTRDLSWRASEHALCTRPGEQSTSAQPLDQRHLDLRLPSHRGGEADLTRVVAPYHLRACNFLIGKRFSIVLACPVLQDTASG